MGKEGPWIFLETLWTKKMYKVGLDTFWKWDREVCEELHRGPRGTCGLVEKADTDTDEHVRRK